MAKITLADHRLPAYTLGSLPLLGQLNQQGEGTEVCIERARHITTYLRDLADPQEPQPLRYAKAVRCFLSNKAPRFFDGNLLAGTTTSKRIGAAVCPEATRLLEGTGLEDRSPGSGPAQRITEDESEELAMRILPFWRGRGLMDAVGIRHTSVLHRRSRIVVRVGDRAGIAVHEEPCLRLALERGLGWLIQQAADREKALLLEERDGDGITAQRALQETLSGLAAYSANLGRFASLLAEGERTPARQRQLEVMAGVCAQVPHGPARTFREAVNALWLLLIGLQAENLHQSASPGRLDQLLYPWYRRDIDRGALTVQEALELVSCLWLKLGDHAPVRLGSYQEHWGGTAMVPEITLGGIGSGGEDAVNDLTYVMLRATELLGTPVPRLNVRCHRERNSATFLRRAAEVMARNRAVAVFPDDGATVDGLQGRGLPPGQARDFSILGCGNGDPVEGPREDPAFRAQDPLLALANCTRTAEPGREDPAIHRTLERFWDSCRRQLSWTAG